MEKNIGVDGVKQLFAELTELARKLGHKGLHFHSSGFYSPNSKEVGYNTAGSYNPFTWVADNYQPKNIELPDYGVAAADVAFKLWPKHHDDFAIPYLPPLSPGASFHFLCILQRLRPFPPECVHSSPSPLH